jgi:hypothetical protein
MAVKKMTVGVRMEVDVVEAVRERLADELPGVKVSTYMRSLLLKDYREWQRRRSEEPAEE